MVRFYRVGGGGLYIGENVNFNPSFKKQIQAIIKCPKWMKKKFPVTYLGPMIFRFKKIDFPFLILVISVSFRFRAIFTDC